MGVRGSYVSHGREGRNLVFVGFDSCVGGGMDGTDMMVYVCV